MTTSSTVMEQKISANNPQGNLPEIEVPQNFTEEQMEFLIDSVTALGATSGTAGMMVEDSGELLNQKESQELVSANEVEKEMTAKLDMEAESEVLLSSNLISTTNETLEMESDLDANSIYPSIDSLEAPLIATEPLSMPAALCDEQLLQELNAIPDKMGFKIGDVADLLGIKQYVLRYWESEFDILKPKKANNNQRLYTKKDVENAFLIRKLLHRDRFSIEGARSALKGLKAFVKKENIKEKEIKQVIHKIDSYQERLENLAVDVRRVRQLFK